MTPELKCALADKLLAMADDELVLAHRNSEWTGHAPILEEDIAFANIAQDELGHAILWYEMYCQLMEDDPDRLVFFREADAYRNVQMVELPKGDWAFSMLRQYLFDAAEKLWLEQLAASRYEPLAAAAAKMGKEELYHLRHTGAWVRRLGLGTAESHARTQRALDQLWPYARQLFVPLPDDTLLVEARFAPDLNQLRPLWEAEVRSFLTAAGLQIPAAHQPPTTSRREHTEHLAALLAEMQSVARLDPQVTW